MTGTRSYKQGLARVLHHWEGKQYDRALGEVEEMLTSWPGNPQLHIMWASLVQLSDGPSYSLNDAKKALQQAVELDKGSPAGAIELGHFLDAVEDNPQGASRAFADGILSARRLLIEGLLGQARALLQLDKRDEAYRCVTEALYLAGLDPASRKGKSGDAAPDVLFRDPTGRLQGLQLKGPFASQIEELLTEVLANRSA